MEKIVEYRNQLKEFLSDRGLIWCRMYTESNKRVSIKFYSVLEKSRKLPFTHSRVLSRKTMEIHAKKMKSQFDFIDEVKLCDSTPTYMKSYYSFRVYIKPEMVPEMLYPKFYMIFHAEKVLSHLSHKNGCSFGELYDGKQYIKRSEALHDYRSLLEALKWTKGERVANQLKCYKMYHTDKYKFQIFEECK